MLEKLIKGIELTEEQKTALSNNFKSVKDELIEVGKNDSEFIKSIKIGAFEEVKRKFRNSFDLDKERTKDLDIENLISEAKNTVEKNLKNKFKSTESEKDVLIQQYKNKVKEFEESVLPNERAKAQEEIKNFLVELKVSDYLSSVQTIGSKNVSKKFLIDELKSNYKVDLDENKNIVVKKQDGAKPVINDRIVEDWTEIGKHILEKNDLIVRNNNGAIPENRTNTIVTPKEMPDAYKKQIARLQAQ